jgi:hypothetical protein
MTRLSAHAKLICLCGLLVPPAFILLGAHELGFASGAIIAAYWIGVVSEAWIDFGRPSGWLLLSGLVVLVWPSFLLLYLFAG